MKTSSARIAGLGTTIFAEMSALAVRTGSINLGQGFPDTDGPASIIDAAAECDAGRPQPVRARPSACPSCAPRSPRTSSGSTV